MTDGAYVVPMVFFLCVTALVLFVIHVWPMQECEPCICETTVTCDATVAGFRHNGRYCTRVDGEWRWVP